MFEAFVVAVYFIHVGVFAIFVSLERNRNGNKWRLRHLLLLSAAAIWPLLIMVALIAALVKVVAAAWSSTMLMISRPEVSTIEAGNRGQ
ncbi:hypothetical protein [Agrobacterium rosae]|uniref:hypothetical protein n=1 Tax=Agrobacterium rosae TaxID=1972867 RepID=UPI003A80299F